MSTRNHWGAGSQARLCLSGLVLLIRNFKSWLGGFIRCLFCITVSPLSAKRMTLFFFFGLKITFPLQECARHRVHWSLPLLGSRQDVGIPLWLSLVPQGHWLLAVWRARKNTDEHSHAG